MRFCGEGRDTMGERDGLVEGGEDDKRIGT
jgi:hypothetical protein